MVVVEEEDESCICITSAPPNGRGLNGNGGDWGDWGRGMQGVMQGNAKSVTAECTRPRQESEGDTSGDDGGGGDKLAVVVVVVVVVVQLGGWSRTKHNLLSSGCVMRRSRGKCSE
jgi:hypothetical protein